MASMKGMRKKKSAHKGRVGEIRIKPTSNGGHIVHHEVPPKKGKAGMLSMYDSQQPPPAAFQDQQSAMDHVGDLMARQHMPDDEAAEGEQPA